jgi:putative ATPase
MVEDDRAVPEVLTTGPTNRSQDAWLQRAIANTGRHLGQVRNRVFELAQIQRHYLILDLNAGSGLLTWEAVRRAPEGGIWALAADQQSGDALRQMAERMPELERPVIMIGEMVELAELFKLRGEEDVRFNRILGRNAFNHNVARVDQMLELAHKLLSGGLLCLAQVVPQNGQRLYDLVDWGDLPAQLHDQVRDAEESIYRDPDDPLVNWQRMDLEAQLQEAGFEDIRLTVEIVSEQRHISQEQLDRWFAAVPGGRQSYSERLARILPDDQLLQVERLYRRQLMGNLVTWRSTQIYVAAGLRKAT